jgi:hypothetical protein
MRLEKSFWLGAMVELPTGEAEMVSDDQLSIASIALKVGSNKSSLSNGWFGEAGKTPC